MTFEAIDSESVITVQASDDLFLMGHSTFRLADFLEAVRNQYDQDDAEWKWLLNGVDCELLKPKQGWQKGKVKLTMTFVPNQAEQITGVKSNGSELEELRQISTH